MRLLVVSSVVRTNMLETLMLTAFATTAINLCSISTPDKIIIDGVEYTLVYPSATDQETPPPPQTPQNQIKYKQQNHPPKGRKKRVAKGLHFASIGLLAGGGVMLILSAALYMDNQSDEDWALMALFGAGAFLSAGIVTGIISSSKRHHRSRRRLALSPWATPDSGGLNMLVTW